jgi:hypothetical protein
MSEALATNGVTLDVARPKERSLPAAMRAALDSNRNLPSSWNGSDGASVIAGKMIDDAGANQAKAAT